MMVNIRNVNASMLCFDPRAAWMASAMKNRKCRKLGTMAASST